VLFNIRKETPSVLLLRRKKWVERKGGGGEREVGNQMNGEV